MVTFPKGNCACVNILFLNQPLAVDYVVDAEYADASALHIGRFRVKAGAPTTDANTQADPPVIKLKVRLNIDSLFAVETAEMVETYYVEEEVPASEAAKTDKAADKPADKPADAKESKDGAADAAAGAPTDDDAKPMETDETPNNDTTATANDTAAEGDDNKADANKADANKPTTVQKRKKRRRFLAVEAELSGALSEKELNRAVENEAKMVANDRLCVETAEAKNTVETYIYTIRDKLSHELKDYCTDEEKEKFLPVLQATEDWLYDEGDDQTRSVYVNRLKELQVIG